MSVGKARPKGRAWSADASYHAMMWGLGAAVLLVSLGGRVDPAGRVRISVGSGGFPLPVSCGLREISGLPCPGCGLSRSFVACGGGRWSAAAARHPLGPALYFLLLAQLPYRTWRLWGTWRFGSAAPTARDERWLLALVRFVAGLLLAVWLWRLATGGLEGAGAP